MPVKTLPKSSVNRALNALGDRWSQLIIREAFLGATQFNEFSIRCGMARSTLAQRLRFLVKNGILERRSVREGMARQDYHLTLRGRGLFDSVLLAWAWGLRWGVLNPGMPTTVIHTGCGKPMIPEMVCTYCKEKVVMRQCSYADGPGAGAERVSIQRVHRRSKMSTSNHPPHVIDLTGDRWTGLVISAQYFGLHRFDDIQAYLGIATNILADRLKVLEANGMLERRLYDLAPPRYEYWLTKKGMDTYPHSLSVMFWGDKWLSDAKGPPIYVRHRPCKHRLGAAVVCGNCKDVLTPESVKARQLRKNSRS
jgi:DNA-binding HxlR family transcriptional regulator